MTVAMMSISYSRTWTKFFTGVTVGHSTLTNPKVYKWTSAPLDNLYPNPPHNYTLAGLCIKHSLINRYLGLLVQSDLKWEAHYNLISAKAYKVLGLLKRTFSSTNSIRTIIFPHTALNYATYCHWKKYKGEPQSLFLPQPHLLWPIRNDSST